MCNLIIFKIDTRNYQGRVFEFCVKLLIIKKVNFGD